MSSRVSLSAVAFLTFAAATFAVGTTVPGTTLPVPGEDLPVHGEGATRRVMSLSGTWTLTAKPRPAPPLHEHDLLVPIFANTVPATAEPIEVQVPGVWQTQGLGMHYHTAAEYRRTFAAPERDPGERVWLHFSRASTHATVTLNGQAIGEHLGAWTPFAFDVTDHLQASNELVVHVDERPEHWTAGFIRNVHPSFGGLWGDVWLETRPGAFISDVFVHLHPGGDVAEARVQIANGKEALAGATVQFAVERGHGTPPIVANLRVGDLPPGGTTAAVRFSADGLDRWSPESPALHRATVRLAGHDGRVVDVQEHVFGLRTFSADGDVLMLNGEPIYWAGVLHWGLYPELLVPGRTREQYREEIRRLKALGFNAVNVCLFVFPDRFYEVADEEGMMVWQEYPLWLYFAGSLRPTTDAERETLVAEYADMYRLVRPHASVLLHSLAVEDPDGDEALMQRMFDLCHEMIPHSVVQDNSAFLNQKIADFLDHHHYDELEGYRTNMQAWMDKVHGRGKRLLLFGEAMDFDTLRNTQRILANHPGERPWWTLEEFNRSLMIPGNSNDFWNQEKVLAQIEEELGPGTLDRIEQASRERSWAARKYQLEISRLHQGFGGMAITAIRDTICSRSGIFDDLGAVKWNGPELPRFNAPTLPLVRPDRESFSYRGGETATLRFSLSHFGKGTIGGATLDCRLAAGEGTLLSSRFAGVSQKPGHVGEVATWEMAVPEVGKATTALLSARLLVDGNVAAENEWRMWIFPKRSTEAPEAGAVHDPEGLFAAEALAGVDIPQGLLLASVLDERVKSHLAAGGSAVLVDPKGAAFPSHGTLFWREVAVERFDVGLFADFPWTGGFDLPWFGLSSGMAYDLSETRRPLLRTINCRHMQRNDVIVETSEHGGRLVATTLKLPGNDGPAGADILQRLADFAAVTK